MSLVPLLNLFIPIIAVVWMVHLYHYIKEKEIIKERKKQEKLNKKVKNNNQETNEEN
jgi:hypothetical protein